MTSGYQSDSFCNSVIGDASFAPLINSLALFIVSASAASEATGDQSEGRVEKLNFEYVIIEYLYATMGLAALTYFLMANGAIRLINLFILIFFISY